VQTQREHEWARGHLRVDGSIGRHNGHACNDSRSCQSRQKPRTRHLVVWPGCSEPGAGRRRQSQAQGTAQIRPRAQGETLPSGCMAICTLTAGADRRRGATPTVGAKAVAEARAAARIKERCILCCTPGGCGRSSAKAAKIGCQKTPKLDSGPARPSRRFKTSCCAATLAGGKQCAHPTWAAGWRVRFTLGLLGTDTRACRHSRNNKQRGACSSQAQGSQWNPTQSQRSYMIGF
jgi:hypothetical protein